MTAAYGWWRTPARRSARCAPMAGRRRAGQPVGTLAFYPNKQLTTGEGGAVLCPSAALKERIDSERNQGRAPDMGWLDHDRLGFNYRLDDLSCALGLAQLERLDSMLAGRSRVAALYSSALEEVEGLELPCPDEGGERRSWFVYVVQLPPGVDRAAAMEGLRERGIDSKPYFPAIHLLSFYRERFGHREGEFPVCEDVAARSLALPFHPELTDGSGGACGGGGPRGGGDRRGPDHSLIPLGGCHPCGAMHRHRTRPGGTLGSPRGASPAACVALAALSL